MKEARFFSEPIIKEIERFDYRKISEQVRELIDVLSKQPAQIRREKYTQISDRAFEFLTSGAFNNLPQNEKEIVLFYLLTSPSPKEQNRILSSLSILFKNQESFEIKDLKALEIERKELAKHLILQETLEEALEGARRDGFWSPLLNFFQNPENQNKFPKIVEEALEGARKHGRWDSLLNFFQNPENQKKYSEIFKDIFQEVLEEARKWGKKSAFPWDSLLNFFQNPENQKKFPDIILEVLKGVREAERLDKSARCKFLLSFFQNPENQKNYPKIFEDIFQEALKEAREYGWWYSLLNFFQNPENQNKFPKIVAEVFKETSKCTGYYSSILDLFSQNSELQEEYPFILQEILEEEGRMRHWYSLLNFFQNPENQNKFPDLFQKALEEARRDKYWDPLLFFFQNPENQPKEINESCFINVKNSLFSISDKNLRMKFLTQIERYLTNNESLALISLSRAEDLPLLITGKNLGLDPFVILSWNLSEEERESLLPTFISLANKDIKFDFPFPYYPRQELKKTRKHNEMLIDYFRTLDFILSLPEEVKGVDLIKNHFENVKKIIKKYKVEQTTLDISYDFLKATLTEIKELKKLVTEKLRELIKISQDVMAEDIIKFIKESPYFPIIFTLTLHYLKGYENGLPLLGKITSSLIKDHTLKDYFQMRYDINDEKTRKQLNPLLEGKNPEEYLQIIEKWRKHYYTFKIFSREERKKIETTEINWDQVGEHIKSQTFNDKHYEQLFELEEFKNLDEKSKNKIRETIEIIFTSEKKTIKFGEIIEMLKGKLDKEKINILIGYFQLLKDLALKQKTLQEILSSIERLNNNIQKNWPEFGQLIIWQQDIYNYLTQLIKEQEKGRKIIKKQTVLLSYFTDHPKTLLEIGKYPVSTCQSYESTGSMNTKLLGYVFDAHIKALVLREIEIETEEEIKEEDLNQAQVEIDEEKEEIIITFPNGKTIKGKISKPIARRIIMLGKKEEKPTLLLEPIYSKFGKGDKTYEVYLDSPLRKIRNELNLGIAESGEGITLPESHNPAGYYRDV